MLITPVETVENPRDHPDGADLLVESVVDDLRGGCGLAGDNTRGAIPLCHQDPRGSPEIAWRDPLNDPQFCPQVWVEPSANLPTACGYVGTDVDIESGIRSLWRIRLWRIRNDSPVDTVDPEARPQERRC